MRGQLVADPARRCGCRSVLAGDDSIRRLSFALPQIHRAPDGSLYATGATFRSPAGTLCCARPAPSSTMAMASAPPHYRALGRSAFLASALAADRKLDRTARSFDFLLSISPINTEAAFRPISDRQGEVPPPLPVPPADGRSRYRQRKLYAHQPQPSRRPLLERAVARKRRTRQQLTMLAARNTPAFPAASTMLYGTVDPSCWPMPRPCSRASENAPRPRGRMIDADDIARRAGSIAAYRAADAVSPPKSSCATTSLPF